MANPIDRLIGWINPHAGLARHFARQRLARAYESASPRDTWRPRRAGASANADHMADAATLRVKARALVQNVPYVRAGMDALVSYTVGTGIMPRPLGKDSAKIAELLAAWFEVCDADGRLDFVGMQAAAYRAMEQDGEVLIRLRSRRPEDGLPIPLQLQLLEIDWLDHTRVSTENGNEVVNGIEYDFLGRVVAYWLWDQHPGDITLRRGLRTQSKRVPAQSIIHLFNPDRPGQGRGFPRLAPVIARVRDLQLYEDAELARKNNETRLSVLYAGDATDLENSPPETGGTSTARTTGNLGELQSGSILEVPAGGNLTVVSPTAAPGYTEYIKQQLHLVAAGMGVTYEMLTGDMLEVNFSSARVRLLQFRTCVEQMRWTVLRPKLLSPIIVAALDAAYLAGLIGKPDYRMDWSAPKWDYVNPEQEGKADALDIASGLSSISEKLRQRGYDPQLVFAEIKSDFDQLKSLGVLDTLLFLQKGKSPTEEGTAAANDQNSRTLAGLANDVRHIDTLVRAQRPPEVTVNQGDTIVHEREVSVAAPVVNVGAPTVNVAPPSVTVERSEVHVEQPASVPAELAALPGRFDAFEARIEKSVARATKAKPRMQVIHETDPATGLPTRSYLAPMPTEQLSLTE